MASIYSRPGRHQLWIKYRDQKGDVQRKPTEYVVGQETEAAIFAARLDKAMRDARGSARANPLTVTSTVAEYAAQWLKAARRSASPAWAPTRGT